MGLCRPSTAIRFSALVALDRPVNAEWDFENGEAPPVTERYFKYLEIFKRALEEEELKISGGDNELSELVKWSQDSGAM